MLKTFTIVEWKQAEFLKPKTKLLKTFGAWWKEIKIVEYEIILLNILSFVYKRSWVKPTWMKWCQKLLKTAELYIVLAAGAYRMSKKLGAILNRW